MPKPKSKKQKKWYPKLFPVHKHQWKRSAYKRLLPKLSRLRQKWGDGIEDEIFEVYGSQCPYCEKTLKVKNISVDHIESEYNGGATTLENARIVCKRCNTRKGTLSHKEYVELLEFLAEKSDHFSNYVLRKLAQQPIWKIR